MGGFQKRQYGNRLMTNSYPEVDEDLHSILRTRAIRNWLKSVQVVKKKPEDAIWQPIHASFKELVTNFEKRSARQVLDDIHMGDLVEETRIPFVSKHINKSLRLLYLSFLVAHDRECTFPRTFGCGLGTGGR